MAARIRSTRSRRPSAVVANPLWAVHASAIAVNALFLLLSGDPEGLFGAVGHLTLLDQLIIAAYGGLTVAGLAVGARGLPLAGPLLLLGPVAMGALALLLVPQDWSLALPILVYNANLAWVVARRRWRGEAPSDAAGLPTTVVRPASVAAAPAAAVPAAAPRAPLRQRLYLALHAPGLWLSGHAVVLGLLVVGYGVSDSPWALGIALSLGGLAVACSIAAEVGRRVRRGLRGPLGEWLLLLALPWAVLEPYRLLAWVSIRQSVVLLRVAYQARASRRLISYLFRRPARLLCITFFLIICAGALLLTFPVSSGGSEPLTGLDALFISTSATCVTGLATVDPATALSFFGQVVVLVLIQVGGLGFMTLSTFAALIVGQRLGLAQQTALGEILDESRPREVYRMVLFIVLATLGIEALGALVLFVRGLTLDLPVGEAAFFGVFHAVSAFCNAGFALRSDNLMSFVRDPLVLGTIGGLIVLGGLGFTVLQSAWSRLLRRRRRLSVQARIMLIGSALLIVVGGLLFLTFEWNRTLSDLPLADRIGNALFMSITARTAGFASVDVTAIGPATVLLLTVWMFIGAGPGSTGGGVKVSTAVVVGLAVRAVVTGQAEVRVGDRSLPREVVLRAIAVVALSLLVVVAGAFALLTTHAQPPERLVFETVSAFGTVGLSMSVTPLLGAFGKLTVIVLMYIGRVGPLTLMLALHAQPPPSHGLPSEHVMVG